MKTWITILYIVSFFFLFKHVYAEVGVYTASVLLYVVLGSFVNSYKTDLIHNLVQELTSSFIALSDTITSAAKK